MWILNILLNIDFIKNNVKTFGFIFPHSHAVIAQNTG